MTGLRFLASAIADDESSMTHWSQGGCHVFALAAHEALNGYGFRVFTDPYDTVWQEPDGSDRIDSVVHVYAVIHAEGRDWAVDAFGIRPLEDAQRESESRFAQGIQSFIDLDTAVELMELVQQGIGTERDFCLPLRAIDPAEMDLARRDVGSAFGTRLKMIFPVIEEEALRAYP